MTELRKPLNRTDQQRKAIEVYCRLLSEAINDAGFEMKAVLEVKQVDVPWTQDRVKDILWKSLQAPMFPETVNDKGEASTTKLESGEVNKVYEVLDRHIAEHFGVHIPFPDRNFNT